MRGGRAHLDVQAEAVLREHQAALTHKNFGEAEKIREANPDLATILEKQLATASQQ